MANSSEQFCSVECPVCLEMFNDPRILPCYHTLCRVCLSTQIATSIARNWYTCPVCRATHKVPDKGVSDIQKNFYVVEMMEIVKKKSEYPLCKEHHTEDLRFYCTTCETSICRDCKVVDHARHKINMISDVAKKKRAEVQNVLNGIEQKQNELQAEFQLYRIATVQEQYEAKVAFAKVGSDIQKLVSSLNTLGDDIRQDILNYKLDITNECKRNFEKYRKLRSTLDDDKALLTPAVEEKNDDSIINKCNSLLRSNKIGNNYQSFSPDPIKLNDLEAFKESFTKWFVNCTSGISNFQNHYNQQFKALFSIPKNKGKSLADGSDKLVSGDACIKHKMEEQPGPSSEPPAKKVCTLKDCGAESMQK